MILYITRKFSPSIGGMQRFNTKLVDHLQQITPLKLISWGGGQAVLPLFLIFAFFKAIIIFLTQPIRCIYVSDGVLSPLGYVLKIITRKPTVANIHGSDIAYDLKVYQMIIPWCLNRLDKVICVSHRLKQECQNRGISEKKIIVIPNGVDLNDFPLNNNQNKRKEIEQLLKIPLSNRPVLLTVGRLIPNKGIDYFLTNIFPKIILTHPNIVYLIVGDGPLQTNIKNIINQNDWQTNVFLLGAIAMDSPLLNIIYQSADLFVMPNISYKGKVEGFGIVAIEASAAGLPVVASKLDGITESVKEGKTGFLVEYTEHQKFADTISNLLTDSSTRQSLGQKAREYVKSNYSWNHIAQQYLQQFNNLT